MTDDLDPKHERAVEEFIEGVREVNPVRVAEVEVRYPVLSERELAWRRGREVGFTAQCTTTGVLTAFGRPPIPVMADLFGRRMAILSF
jgi:hypothetical protein